MEALMQLGISPLLEGYRIFRSRCVDEAHAYLQCKRFQLDISPRRASEFDTRVNGVYLPGMWFGYFQYGPPVATRAVGRDDYWVQLPVHGDMETTSSTSNIACDRRRAAVLSPTRTDFYMVRSSSSCGRLCLSLKKAGLVGQLAALLGERPTAPLELAPVIDLTTGYGRSLARYVLMAVTDLEKAGSVLWSPATMATFEQFIMTALLLAHPHNYSNVLQQLEKAIAPRDVRRAVDYIEANLEQPITVADLVEATGVAGRTLFMHFKNFKGVSPMRYLRNARLKLARQALLQAGPEASVTQIATNLGFTHMGRFSIYYREFFGESPAQTLRSRNLQHQPRKPNSRNP